jgi:hypothetical protein
MKPTNFKYKWTLYFSLVNSNAPEYGLLKSVFEKLLAKLGEGSLKEIPDSDFDGNPRDGFRRPVILKGHVEGKWHFRVWAGTEWKYDPELETRFELPISIESNLPWNEDKQIWDWLVTMLSEIGYEDRMMDTYSIRDLIKRLEQERLLKEAKCYKEKYRLSKIYKDDA